MAKKDRSNLVNVAILLFSVAIVISAVIWGTKNAGIVAPLTYINTDINLQFDYPANLSAVDEQVSKSIHSVNLYQKGRENISKEVISVTTLEVDELSDIVDVAANYLEVNTSKINKVDKADVIEARYIKYSANGEVSYYNFFKDGSRLDVIRFNQKVYDANNPLILLDNSYYNFAYSTILSTLSFSPDI